MKSDAIAFGIAGILFGLIAGWVIGSHQAKSDLTAAPPVQQAAQAAAGSTQGARTVDQNQVATLKADADRDAANPRPRVQLGNLYFDAEQYDEAIKWYADAFRLSPKDVNVSTDLGVSYYYTNQPDKALQQFEASLKLDPKHTKTLLNVGIVKAWGKQDLDGAQAAWRQVIQLAPDSQEGQQAKLMIERLNSSHPAAGQAQQPGG